MSRLIGWNAFGVILSIIIGFIPSIIAFVKNVTCPFSVVVLDVLSKDPAILGTAVTV